jgi:hypothetical protein
LELGKNKKFQENHMNFPIIFVDSRILLFMPLISFFLGIIFSLAPYFFMGKKALLAIPIAIIPVIGFIFIMPNPQMLILVIGTYVCGLLAGSAYFFDLYLKRFNQSLPVERSLVSGTVSITTGPLASKGVKIFYLNAKHPPVITQPEEQSCTYVDFGNGSLYIDHSSCFVNFNFPRQELGVRIYSQSNQVSIYPVILGSLSQ